MSEQIYICSITRDARY